MVKKSTLKNMGQQNEEKRAHVNKITIIVNVAMVGNVSLCHVILDALIKRLFHHFSDAFSACCCLRVLLFKTQCKNRKEHFLSYLK